MFAASEIREVIAAALRREEQTGELRASLASRMPDLRDKLVIAEDNPVAALLTFVTGYIRSVPSCLRLVTAVSRRQGFYDYAAPFLDLAGDYFLHPPGEVPRNGGLETLLDAAFLSHRLLEEVNDHHVRNLCRPLLPVDMTEANIIVHHLLGDELATGLEEMVQSTAEQLLDKEHVWDRARALAGPEPEPLVTTGRLAGPQPQVRLRLAS